MENSTLSEIFELGTEELIDVAVKNNEGVIASNGALSLETGERTGRSPNDRFIVEEDSTSHLIDWGDINKPFDADKFSLLWDKVDAYLAEKDRYLSKVHVGAHADHYIPVNVMAESASHSMFSRLIFISPTEFNPQEKKEWQIMSALNYQCSPEEDGTNSEGCVIINFAAESFVDRSIADAKPFLKSNIDGVFTILESIKKHKKKFLQISTDEVFGSLDIESASETFQYNPSSPYAATKACAEMLVNSYHITYDCDTLITRCTNNYGPRQFPEKLIPKTLLLAKNNKKIPIYGTGKNLRDWLYVDDHCDAILSCLNNGKSGESYNISSGNEIDNLTIIKKILSIMDKSEDLMEFVDDRPGHDFRYSMNSNKLQNELGWKSKTNFELGIENTVNWYLNNSKWWENLSESIFEHTPWKK